MYPVTNEFKLAAKQPVQEHRLYGTIGSVSFDESNIIQGSFHITNQCTDTNDVVLGSVYTGTLTATFTGLSISRYAWIGKRITVYFGLKVTPTTWEDIPMGIFTVKEAKHSAEGVSITAYDDMIKLDKKFKKSKFKEPAKIYNFLTTICNTCGLILEDSEQTIQSRPNGNTLLGIVGTASNSKLKKYANDIETYRDLVFWIAQSMACFATINKLGHLMFVPYKNESNVVDEITEEHRIAGAVFDDFTTNYTGIYVTNTADGEEIYYGYDEQELEQEISDVEGDIHDVNVQLDQLAYQYQQGQITEAEYKRQKKVLDKQLKNLDKRLAWLNEALNKAQSEEDGLYMDLGENPMMQADGVGNTPTTMRRRILNALDAISYTPFTCDTVCGAHYDLGDIIRFTGGHATELGEVCCVMAYDFNMNGEYRMQGFGSDPSKSVTKSKNAKKSNKANKNAVQTLDDPLLKRNDDGTISVNSNKEREYSRRMYYTGYNNNFNPPYVNWELYLGNDNSGFVICQYKDRIQDDKQGWIFVLVGLCNGSEQPSDWKYNSIFKDGNMVHQSAMRKDFDTRNAHSNGIYYWSPTSYSTTIAWFNSDTHDETTWVDYSFETYNDFLTALDSASIIINGTDPKKSEEIVLATEDSGRKAADAIEYASKKLAGDSSAVRTSTTHYYGDANVLSEETLSRIANAFVSLGDSAENISERVKVVYGIENPNSVYQKYLLQNTYYQKSAELLEYINPNNLAFSLTFTNWIYDYGDKIELTYKMNSAPNTGGDWPAFLGCGENNNALYVAFNLWNERTAMNVRYNGQYTGDANVSYDTPYDYSNYYKVVMDANEFKLYKGSSIDDTSTLAASHSFTTLGEGSSNSAVKFLNAINQNTLDVNIYSIVVHDKNGQLIHEYLPIQDGLFDTVDETMYVVETTGHIYGNVVGEHSVNKIWIKLSDGTWAEWVDDGQEIVIDPKYFSGTKIADISVDGETYYLYAPSGGGSASSLDELTDVDILNPANGQVLSYDEDNQKWVNSDISGTGSSYDETILYSGNTRVTTMNLSNYISNFDAIEFEVTWVYSSTTYCTSIIVTSEFLSTGKLYAFGLNNDRYVELEISSQNIVTWHGGSDNIMYISCIKGVKYGGSNIIGTFEKTLLYEDDTKTSFVTSITLSDSWNKYDAISVDFNNVTKNRLYFHPTIILKEYLQKALNATYANGGFITLGNEEGTYCYGRVSSTTEITNIYGSGLRVGAIYGLKFGGARELNDLSDVAISSPSNGQLLTFNDTENKWINANKPSYTASDVGAVATTAKGAINGVAELDANGKVPSTQLPSMLQLGETSNTAYRGDRGKTAYDHATDSNRITTVVTSGLYKFSTTAQGHIGALMAVEKTDLTGLGVADAADIPTKTSDLTNDSGYITSYTDEKVTAEDVNPSSDTGYLSLCVPALNATSNQKPKAPSGYMLSIKNGTSSAVGHAFIRLGNSTASGSANNKCGKIRLYSQKTKYVDLVTTANMTTADRTITLPDKDGTIALTKDLTTYAFAEGANNGEIKITPSVGGTAGTAVTVKPKGISDLAYIAKGSGSSKFLREDGQWTTVTASWSGGDITQDILPASGYTLHLGSGTRPFENVVSTYLSAKSSVSIGKTNATTGKIYLYQSNSSYSSVIQPSDTALSAAQTFKLPSASGTLVTDSYLNSNYIKNDAYVTGFGVTPYIGSGRDFVDLGFNMTNNYGMVLRIYTLQKKITFYFTTNGGSSWTQTWTGTLS